MMKKIILAITLVFGGVAFVNAQDQQQDTTQTQTQQSEQYRTEDSQNQSDSTQSESTQSDSYRTEGDGSTTTTDSTSNESATQSTTGTESTTTTGNESSATGSQPMTTDEQSSTGTVSQDDQEQEGEKIEVSELPAAIQTKLQSTDYQGWVVTSARKKMWTDANDAQATAKEVYVVEAKNGSETKKLKFDKDGNEIEHDKDKKDDQK